MVLTAEGIEQDYNPTGQARTVRPGETEGRAQGPTARQGQSGPWNVGLPRACLCPGPTLWTCFRS